MSTRSLTYLFSIACSLVLLGCGGTRAPARSAGTATPQSVERATAPELADAAATLAGTWDCRGSVFGPEGPSPSTVILDARLVLNDTWLQTDFAVASGRYPYGFTAHRTFEASSGSWVSLIVDNLGGHATSRSADGITWTGASRGPMGEMQIRDSETMLSPGRMIMVGQYSLDGGTSWSTGYELSCER